MTGHPAYASVRPRDAIFVLILAATSLEYMLHKLLHMFAILGVHDLEHSLKAHWLRFRKAKQPSPFLRYPKFVILDVPNPQTEVRCVDREVNARFALAQRGLAGLKLLGKLRGAEEFIAQLIAHRRDNALIEQARRQRHRDDAPGYYDRVRGRREDKENNAHHQRLPPIAPPPDGNCGIRHEDH